MGDPLVPVYHRHDRNLPSLCAFLTMIFDKPQWKWRAAYAPSDYGFVSNRIAICPLSGKSVTAFVVVPTEFFQLLPIIFPGNAAEVARKEGVSFYLDGEAKGSWVLGAETNNGEHSVDLWRYPASATPSWVDLALRKK